MYEHTWFYNEEKKAFYLPKIWVLQHLQYYILKHYDYNSVLQDFSRYVYFHQGLLTVVFCSNTYIQ